MKKTHILNGDAFAASLLSLSLLLGIVPPRARAATTTTPATHAAAPSNAADTKSRVEQSLATFPARFEANAGQAGEGVRFLSRGAQHTLLLGAGGATLALKKGEGKEDSGGRLNRRALGESARGARTHESSYQLVNMKFVGANPRAEVAGEGALAGKVNYFVGRDASKWRTGVPTYSGVRYRGLYPGVDLVFHGGGDGERLEYDFVLAPGADYSRVTLRFEGADRLSLSENGELLLHTKTGTIKQSAPVIYQQTDGSRREVAGGYVLRGRREVGFRLAGYDRSAPLVIDPVLVYSTYFPVAAEMAVDASGAVYVVGTADSFFGDFPVTPGAFQTTLKGFNDAYVAKLDASGAGFSYLTYIGGGGNPNDFGEYGQDIAIDAAGNAYITGLTYSTDFPLVNAFQSTRNNFVDAFVTKLNANGSALVYSTYLGGNGSELGDAIALDGAGSAYVYGDTDSTDFPVKNALQPSMKGSVDLFLTKFAPDGKTLAYSTYLGGSDYEPGYLGDMAVDAAGAVYVAGTTYSKDFPITPGAFQTTPKTVGDFFASDAFVTKIAPGGASLVYSTYLGGTGSDYAHGIALDAAGQAYVVGETISTDFPTQNALQPSAVDIYSNGFVTKLNAAGSALVYSTYLGGTQSQTCLPRNFNSIEICNLGEHAMGVAADAAGNAYVTGSTTSRDFPAPLDALQTVLNGPADAYVIKLGPAGQALYATYLGGSSYDDSAEVALDAAGTLYLLGYTASDDFPTVNPYRDSFARDFDPTLISFLSKLSEASLSGQTSRVQFDAAAYVVGEGGRFAQVGVTRSGDLSQAVSVDYSTGDDTAFERTDYTTARGTLRFAPGETLKTFNVSVTNDRVVEGDESLTLTLHDLRGAAVLAAPASARLTINDDDEHPGVDNPIDNSQFFVRQHYLDFLGREPDDAGLQFWTNEIESCGASAACREFKRVNVSAAFFLSIEFQETGFLVERLFRLAFAARVPYHTFVHDARVVGDGVVVGQGNWQQRLAANRRAYAEEFVARAHFRDEFPDSLTAAQYVERLNQKATGALSPTEFNALVAGLDAGTETRGSVLLKVADDADFRQREFRPAFVLMQYLGYLRRDPDDEGFNFWLTKLEQFGGDYVRAEMVKAFINSTEYRARFHEPMKEAQLGSPFTLHFGETVVVQPDRLRVSLFDIGFDSRCPRGTQCFSPGGITILLQAVKPGGETARFTIRIAGGVPRPNPANPPVTALGYNFRLLQLDPEPPYPQSFAYEALIQVDKN